MEVIGEYDDSIDTDMCRQQAAPPFQERHREKVRTAGNMRAKVMGHGRAPRAAWPEGGLCDEAAN
ncbi:MAG: hypothetical protein ACRDFW_09875, partial [bacterium]